MVLGPGVTHLGRAEDNDLVLPDIGVSRRHARIVVDGGTLRFEDLGSGNGTFYRGQRIESQVLADGDEIVLEPFTLTFHIQVAAAPAMGHSLEDDETMRAPPLDSLTGAPARLVTLAGHRLASAYPLGGAPIAMGRSEARDIVLFDPAASRNHAIVELRAEGFWLRDLGSANGTYVNGQKATEQPLSAGDVIRIGSTEFRFEALGPLPSTSPVEASTAPAQLAAPPPFQAAPQPPAYAAPAPAAQPITQAPVPQAPVTQAPVSIPAGSPAPVSPVAQAPVGQASVAQPPAPPPPPPAGRSGALGALIAAVVAFVLVVGVAAVGIVGWVFYQKQAAADARVAAIDAARAAAAEPAPESSPEVQALMNDGRLLFHEDRPLDAASRFYQVLQEESGNEEAKRLGFIVCEHIAFQQLENDILRKSTSAADQREAVKDATRDARSALAGRGDLTEAEAALVRASVFAPDDAELAGLLAKVRKQRSKALDDAARAELYGKVAPLYQQARGAALDGRDADASAAWQKVVDADPDKHTWYAHEAALYLRAGG
jgi:pSer/pThr/pTyr-binding forkhead associated (FHA) protein